jgi:small-conductance mechanosensitive channel
MALEILDTQIMDTGFTIWNVLVITIIVAVGVIAARIARMIFKRKFAPNLSPDSAKSMGKLLYYGIIIIAIGVATSSQGIDLVGLSVGAGSLGIVIGFASQGVVSNLISGIFLMIEKPVRQGNNVDVPGEAEGKLLDIGIFSSRIQQFDGTVMRIPNQKMFNANIRTFELSEIRRTEMMVGIAYKEDIDKAIAVMKDAIRNHITYALIEPEPQFWVTELGDNSVNISVRVWHPRDDLAEVKPVLLKVIKKALDAEGIEIPFPQRVVEIHDASKK